MIRIDAHQHFWSLARGDYDWLTADLGPIYRDFGPEDLKPNLKRHAIDGTILVQAAATSAETEYMLGLAEQNNFIFGVVGWVDFESKSAPDEIAALARHPKIVGLRPMIQDIADPDWMLRADLAPAFEALVAHNLTFDALTLPRHLPNLARLLARYPAMRVVVDHGSKPDIRSGAMTDWARDIAAIAEGSRAYCKISGLVTEAAENWSVSDLKPYVDHLIDCFGPERLIWGSDWPVCRLAASYDQWFSATNHLLSGLPSRHGVAIRGGNAKRAYALPDQ